MKTKTFLKFLRDNSGKELLFEYLPDHFVKRNYHITEIKNIHIDSVDCGGSSNSWNESIVQLWVNNLEPNTNRAMTAEKALSIFDKVHNIRPLNLDTELKIEYGNKNFHTAQLVVHEIAVNDKSIVVKLHSDTTQCKASVTCCTPISKEKAQNTKVLSGCAC